MAEFSAKDVAELRKQTGCGMMDCKNALKDANGNYKIIKAQTEESSSAFFKASMSLAGVNSNPSVNGKKKL